MDTGEINVKISADTQELERGMASAEDSVNSFAKSTETGTRSANRGIASTERAAKSLAKVKVALAASAAAVSAALVKLAIDGLAAGDEQAKLARAMGLTNEQLAIMERAADLSGISIGQLETSTRQLNRALVDAEDGSGRAAEAFKALNINAADLRGLDIDEQMIALGEAFEGITDSAQRASLAQDLFGRSGGRMLNLIDGAAETIGRARDEVDAFGLALTDQQARAIEAANDNISTLRSAFEGFGLQLAATVAPAIRDISARFIDIAREASETQRSVLQSIQAMQRSGTQEEQQEDRLLVLQEARRRAVADFSSQRLRDRQITQESHNRRLREIDQEIDRVQEQMLIEQTFQAQAEKRRNAQTEAAREEAAREMAAIQLAQERGEALDAAYALTSQGQQEAIKNQIAFFETFEPQGPKATAILEMLNDQLERFNEVAEDPPDLFTDREEQYARELENISRFLMSEEELIEDSHQRRIDTVLSAMENMEITTAEAHAKIEALEEHHQERLNEIQRQAQRSRVMQAMSTTNSIASNLTSFYRDAASSTTNDERKLFEIRKRAGVASALINTAQGVTSALATTPGPFRWVEAAAVSAAGIAQVAAIRSQSFGGSGSTPTPEAPTAAATQGPMQTITVQGDFSAGQMFDGTTVRALMEQLSEASADGARIQIR
jgi:hypothetical protein